MSASGKSVQRERRSARLREALRENLRRRKAQARARSNAEEKADDDRQAQDSAGFELQKPEN